MSLISSLDRKLLRDLVHMRGQGLAVGIIVACGVAIIVMALCALQSLETSRDIYYERYRFADVFASAKRAPESLMSDIREIDGVRVAQSRIVRLATLDIEGMTEPANAQLISLPEEGAPALNDVLLYAGRWPDPRRPDEAVVSKAFLDARGLVIGDTIRAVINGRARDLVVAGVGDSPEHVYMLGPGGMLPDEERFGVFWMGRRALEAAFDLDGAFNDLSLSLSPSAAVETVIDEVDARLDPYGGVGAYAREDQISHAFIDSQMTELKSIARIIPPVFLVVSALLINAILARLIATERQQIGLLKAFGYERREIAWHYVKLALAMVVGGVLAGYAMGAALARLLTGLYADTFRFPDLVHALAPSSFAIGAVAAGFAAVVGALGASLSAARLEAAEAMSPAPPTIYGKDGLQRLIARIRFDEPTRMILRHLSRWPVRAGVTMFGVAAAMALLVGTLFAYDSVDAMMDTRFHRTDPYDAEVSFVEPMNASAVRELERLPGVLSIEAKRDVFARMRFGALSERAYVIGFGRDSRQRRLLNVEGHTVPLPEQGLAVSTQLAAMLGLTRGDTVTLDVLEGRRPTVDATVTAIVDEGMGYPAFMEAPRLNALLGETSVATGAYIMFDPEQRAAFSDAVLARPGIASVSLQSATINSFEETLQETIYIMMSIYALIGGSIAAGVVYNAARIGLTERGRELASLRVLGFSEVEVSYILIGELALLVIAALPVGALLGTGLAKLIAANMSSELYRVPYVVDPSTYGYAAAVVLFASIIAAGFVRERIKRLDLIAVLKTRE